MLTKSLIYKRKILTSHSSYLEYSKFIPNTKQIKNLNFQHVKDLPGSFKWINLAPKLDNNGKDVKSDMQSMEIASELES